MVEALHIRSYCTRCKYSTARVYIINIIQVLMISTVYFRDECLMIFFEGRLYHFSKLQEKKILKLKILVNKDMVFNNDILYLYN